MSVSTTTRLQVINQIMDLIGEKQVGSSVGSSVPVVRKTVTALEEALRTVESEALWIWTYKEAVADSWSVDEATVSDLRLLKQIVYDNQSVGTVNRVTEIPERTNRNDDYTPVSFNTDHTYPSYWFRTDQNVFKFYPYPADSTRQAYIKFRYHRNTTFPSTDNTTFEIPEKFIALLKWRTATDLATTHMFRVDVSQAYEVKYQTLLGNYKRTEVPSTNTLSMYDYAKTRY